MRKKEELSWEEVMFKKGRTEYATAFYRREQEQYTWAKLYLEMFWQRGTLQNCLMLGDLVISSQFGDEASARANEYAD